MLRRGGWTQWGLGALAATAACLLSAGPASATWSAALIRPDDTPSGQQLELYATASAPTYGLHFGLNQAGYTISDISANQAGAGGANACTPTSNSDLTTHNYGIDCSFQDAVTKVTITFTVSPRYPDNAGGKVYDDQDSTVADVSGPPASQSQTPPTQTPPTKADIKQAAMRGAEYQYKIDVSDCDVEMFGGIFVAPLYLPIKARQADCEQEAYETYQMVLAHIDPVDQNFSAVALPSVPQVATLGRARCVKSTAPACRALLKLEQERIQNAAREGAIWAAIDTTLNRLGTAETDSSSTGVATQNAALEAYAGELLQAAGAQDAVDAQLVRWLAKLRRHPHVSAKEVMAEQHALQAGRLPAGVLRGLGERGVSASSLAAAFRSMPAPKPAPLDYISVLRTSETSSLAGLDSVWRSLTAQDLISVVNGLAIAGAIDQSAEQQLDGDASRIDQAADASARRQAAQRFVLDARQAGGEAAVLLQTAGSALV